MEDAKEFGTFCRLAIGEVNGEKEEFKEALDLPAVVDESFRANRRRFATVVQEAASDCSIESNAIDHKRCGDLLVSIVMREDPGAPTLILSKRVSRGGVGN